MENGQAPSPRWGRAGVGAVRKLRSRLSGPYSLDLVSVPAGMQVSLARTAPTPTLPQREEGDPRA
jgi:hypothetical protein